MTTVHDFQEQLAYSEKASDAEFWDAIYRKAFPNMVSHMLCSEDSPSQRMGIDRAILLSNGRTIYIDEKKRKAEYNDILLEYVSVNTTNSPGWMEKDLSIDYLAYAFMESERVYLFPWNMLRRAWKHYKESWINDFRTIKAQNNGYQTYSVAIPIDTLRQAVSTACVIQL